MKKAERKGPSGAAPGSTMAAETLALVSYASDIRSVELKMTIPPERRSALGALGVDPLEGRIREVTFFDTPDLTLYEHGLVLRLRRTQGREDDAVVKVRPLAERLPADLRTSPDMKIEMDVSATSTIVSASLKGVARAPVRAVVEDGHPLERVFTRAQRKFFADRQPSGTSWDDLVALGPIYVVWLRCVPKDIARRITFEQWHFPGQVPLVEVSTKSSPAGVAQVRDETVSWLHRHDLWAPEDQAPKTRTALQFFASHLAAPAGALAAPSTG